MTNEKINALAAKAHAMYGKRLKSEDYSNLLALKNIREIADYLKGRTSYSSIFTSTAVNNELTEELVESLARERNESLIRKIGSYSYFIGDDLYKLIILESDIKVILGSARLIVAPTARENTYVPDDFCKKHSTLNHKLLYSAETVNDFSQALHGTVYYKMLLPHMNVVANRFDLSQMEAQLQDYTYSILENHCKKNPKSGSEFKNLINLRADQFNISLIYRLKKYSDKSNEDIQKHIYSKHGTLSAKQINELISCESDEEYLKILNNTSFASCIDKDSLDYIEGALENSIYKVYKKYLKQSTNPDIQVYSFIYLVRNEYRNLVKIIEGKKYNLPEDEILKLIIGFTH